MADAEKTTEFDASQETFPDTKQYFRSNFNTELTPEEMWRYDEWMQDQSKRLGRDLSEDLDDYDMQGAFKEGVSADERMHWPDTFKKPSHPTFSTDSKYHGAIDQQRGGVYEGGTWGTDEDGHDTFSPSAKMLGTPEQPGTHPETWLRGWFKQNEPDVKLIIKDEQ